MKCKEIQEQKEINLQLENKKKVQKLKEKGITLIALVVTIIILLILAGVTLNMALSGDGLFSRARNAAEKYKKAQKDEAELISEIGKEMNSEYVGAYVTGYNPTKKTDYVIGVTTSGTEEEQKFSTEEMKWRIWDYDGTILRIISDKPTTQKLMLTKENGYNNGVWAINEICRQCYSSNENGVTVRNLRRSDIENVSTYNYTSYKHMPRNNADEINDSNELIHFGEKINYTGDFEFPIIWNKYDSSWSFEYSKDNPNDLNNSSCEYPWENEFGFSNEGSCEKVNESLKFKQTYYLHTYNKSEFKNENYFNLIFSVGKDGVADEQSYWLSGRCIFCYENYVGLGLTARIAKNSLYRISGTDTINSSRRT